MKSSLNFSSFIHWYNFNPEEKRSNMPVRYVIECLDTNNLYNNNNNNNYMKCNKMLTFFNNLFYLKIFNTLENTKLLAACSLMS